MSLHSASARLTYPPEVLMRALLRLLEDQTNQHFA